MGKYIIDETTLENLANAIRRIKDEPETKKYTPEEMIYAVTNIMDSITYMLVDQCGNEYPAVFVETKTIFDATPEDLRYGKTAASDSGVIEGTSGMSSGEVVEDIVYILVDENGNELTAVMTEEIVELTAGANDIRIGKTAVTNDGIVVGTLDV